ncbi:hypothetical protein Mycch_2675 [Mycolicibacterium chubuense NBB4]|uniref:Pilin n=1 Tax=Mycolicibacterium chubuense (strain NBB4) TaxID=710421 RepID=I4BJI5_MYCCN|nr:hypothetical protein Mycch_2675 [Mycolicibacterium chubuense NBB4]
MAISKTWTTVGTATLVLSASVLLSAPSGGTTGSALTSPPPASVSIGAYRAQAPYPLDPPGCWDADGTWHPDCWGPGQWDPGMGPGMMGPGPWGPGMMGPGPWGPGMMGPGRWGD